MGIRTKPWNQQKTCLTCGIVFERPLHDNGKWGTRRYCSRHCAKFKHGITVHGYARGYEAGRSYRVHRKVMEKILGRPLLRSEHVHHRNGDKLDNRPENLEILTTSEHNTLHKRQFPDEKPCSICGGTFKPHKRHRNRQKTCGNLCASISRTLTKRRKRELNARPSL